MRRWLVFALTLLVGGLGHASEARASYRVTCELEARILRVYPRTAKWRVKARFYVTRIVRQSHSSKLRSKSISGGWIFSE